MQVVSFGLAVSLVVAPALGGGCRQGDGGTLRSERKQTTVPAIAIDGRPLQAPIAGPAGGPAATAGPTVWVLTMQPFTRLPVAPPVLEASDDGIAFADTGVVPVQLSHGGSAYAFEVPAPQVDTLYRVHAQRLMATNLKPEHHFSSAVYVRAAGPSATVDVASPVAGQGGVATDPTFAWNAVPGATSYIVVVRGTEPWIVETPLAAWKLGDHTAFRIFRSGDPFLAPGSPQSCVVYALDFTGFAFASSGPIPFTTR